VSDEYFMKKKIVGYLAQIYPDLFLSQGGYVMFSEFGYTKALSFTQVE
jgi:hypothetical protein